ncbi:hypothetical protein PT974_06279 [Cladobotryum mycophilum]|uniref:DUF4185 domain-containing protein n=1 Tax=Cladobotryum mycophilum TaxID=491253 RepID=A0ABR0SL33_9HYPO
MNWRVLLAGLAAQAVAQTTQHHHSHQYAHEEGHYRVAKRQFPSPSPPAFMPEAKSATILANVTDPNVTRDSCGSVKMGFRTLWSCRDTSLRIPGTDKYGFLFVNTVGWTDDFLDGSPIIQEGGPEGAGSTGSNPILLMRGPRPTLPAFYPLDASQCAPSGRCDDGATRWTGWPDSPPMITDTAPDGTITAYTWTTNIHMESASFTVLNPQGSTTLYKMTYLPDLDPNTVPNVTIVAVDFWKDHEIGYGTYGNVVKDGYAYLYGLTDPKAVALARVPVDSVENRLKYEYFVNGTWTSKIPAINDTAAVVPNAGTAGQGTYYYDDKHQSYVWIGQPYFAIWADFFITTAPSPEGPWIQPYKLWSGVNGDGALPAYSLQAHPHFLRPTDDGIYVTWTQFFKETTYSAVYITPLAYISFV